MTSNYKFFIAVLLKVGIKISSIITQIHNNKYINKYTIFSQDFINNNSVKWYSDICVHYIAIA